MTGDPLSQIVTAIVTMLLSCLVVLGTLLASPAHPAAHWQTICHQTCQREYGW